MPESFSKILKGKAKPNRYQEIGYRYMEMVYEKFGAPAWKQLSGDPHGWASWTKHDGRCSPVIAAPNPTNPVRLYVLIHEVGHIMLGHWKNGFFHGCGRKLSDLSSTHEFEAESFALAEMKKLGIDLPEYVYENAYGYVADHIVADSKAGHRINPKALEFARNLVYEKDGTPYVDSVLAAKKEKPKACLRPN